MRAPIAAALALGLAIPVPTPVTADEVEDSIGAALAAYRAGDVKKAKEELDFAAQLVLALHCKPRRGECTAVDIC